jgi:hypothetical protein
MTFSRGVTAPKLSPPSFTSSKGLAQSTRRAGQDLDALGAPNIRLGVEPILKVHARRETARFRFEVGGFLY